MTNLEKYKLVFKDSLNVTDVNLSTLTYQSIDNWDSVGHMALIAALEESFDIMLDTDDIIDFSSYKKGKEILKKYDVNI